MEDMDRDLFWYALHLVYRECEKRQSLFGLVDIAIFRTQFTGISQSEEQVHIKF
jgi:hypothetical protein